MLINKTTAKAAANTIAKVTKADTGILQNISDSLSIGTFKEMSVDILEDFPEHKFNSYDEKELQALANSIKMVGLLDPLLIWETKNGHYYILCGHNRLRACKIAGLKTVTCNVKKYENIDLAKLAVIASNVDRRGGFESLSIEEKINVIIDDFEALNSLYQTDNKKYEIAESLNNDIKEEISMHYKLGTTQAKLYYKIGKTFKKEWVKLIPFHFNIKVAYQLCQLKQSNLAAIIDDIIKSSKKDRPKIIKINDKQVKRLREMEKDGEDIEELILSLYSRKEKNKDNNESKDINSKEENKKNEKNDKRYYIDFNNEIFAPYYNIVQSLDINIFNSIISKALSDYCQIKEKA